MANCTYTLEYRPNIEKLRAFKVESWMKTGKTAKDATDITESLNPLLFFSPLQGNDNLENDTNYSSPHWMLMCFIAITFHTIIDSLLQEIHSF